MYTIWLPQVRVEQSVEALGLSKLDLPSLKTTSPGSRSKINVGGGGGGGGGDNGGRGSFSVVMRFKRVTSLHINTAPVFHSGQWNTHEYWATGL